VRTTAHNATTASTPKTGLLALLGSLLRVKGTGASKITQGSGASTVSRLVLSAVVTTLGVLAFASAPALAAAPEAPTLEVPGRTPTTALLEGVIEPNGLSFPVTPGTYEFLYRKSPTECKGGAHAPSSPGLYFGIEPERVNQEISALEPGSQYSACLSVENTKKEKALSAPATFVLPAEAPETTTPAAAITSTTATLEGTLNPLNTARAGWYFAYAEGGSCQGATETPHEPELEGKALPEHADITGLLPAKTYTFCLIATNESGETTPGNEVSFETPAAPPTVVAESEAVSAVEATAATFEAEIKPDGAQTTYVFQYLTEAEYNAAGKSFTGAAETTRGSIEAVDDNPHAVSAHASTPLLSGTLYVYRVVATNSAGPTVDGPAATFTTRGEATATADTCPNAARRAEQPLAKDLPDCRAYELVSPENTFGQNATEEDLAETARAAEEGAPPQPTTEPAPEDESGAVTYAAAGAFSGTSAEPPGAAAESQYLSRREPARGGWSTQPITPLHEPDQAETGGSFTQDAFNPQLTEGVAVTSAPLTEGAPVTKATNAGGRELGLYQANFAAGSYRYVATELNGLPLGVSRDLSHVVLGIHGAVFEWADGTPFPVGVDNGDQGGRAGVAGWRAVSDTGNDVAFSSDGQLYVRVNVAHHQSAVAEPEADGSGTLTKGSNTVSELVVASGTSDEGAAGHGPGTTKLEVEPTAGGFVVGQPITGSGIEAGTTITAIGPGSEEASSKILTLSKPTSEEVPVDSVISSGGPLPFAVGDRIAGAGVPAGATVTAVAEGSLTLSVPAAASEAGEQLVGGGGCLVSTDACTVEASASERKAENPAGEQPAQYWGASVDGSKVFFTSTAELTEDAYTGPAGEGSNLYQYEPATNTLTDLTAADRTGAGADVQGVAQISEDGSYVYFVADGDLAGSAQEGQPNLYVIHDGGEPSFITTLGGEDHEVWGPSPEKTLASVSPNGQWLTFLSKADLTGYDNDPVHESECAGRVGNANRSENGHCQEAYLYDAASGRLVCASCNPTGARPVGPANLGEPRGTRPYTSLYRPRVLTDAGTLFFASYDALVPGANGLQNVYEYAGGQVHALSDVSGANASFLLDTSASGGDVFFATAERLVPQKTGGAVAVFDARVDGGFPAPAGAPSPCSGGDTCLIPAMPTPPVFGASGTATYSGPGDIAAPDSPTVPAAKRKTAAQVRAGKLATALKQCRKHKIRKKRVACEKQAKRRYRVAQRAKRSSNGRRTK
jgi:hypothetical protein